MNICFKKNALQTSAGLQIISNWPRYTSYTIAILVTLYIFVYCLYQDRPRDVCNTVLQPNVPKFLDRTARNIWYTLLQLFYRKIIILKNNLRR